MSFSLDQLSKTELRTALEQELEGNLATLLRRQEDTQKAATHAENRPEHSKDTRATEQSYLARGLAARVRDLRQAAGQLAQSEVRRFEPDEPVATWALAAMRVEGESASTRCWLVPAAGGFELTVQGAKIRTLTPAAPLGRALLGLHVGDEATFSTPRGERSFELLEIA